MTKEQIIAARKSLDAYWQGSIVQSVTSAYEEGRVVDVVLK